MFSAGCVRLENAPKLARWLYGKPLSVKGASVEQRVDLDRPVPVYLAYLTAMPQGSQIVYYDDVYKRDTKVVAALLDKGGNSPAAAAADRPSAMAHTTSD